MRSTAIRSGAGILALVLGFGPATLQAQVHAQGSCWIHRDADQATWLHAAGDSLCMVEFPARCYGGMMMPDSLYCDFHTTSPESMPRGCVFAYQMHIRDPHGTMMMGRMTFRSSLPITFHYDPQAVAALGIPSTNLVLIRRTDPGYMLVDDATHDPEAGLFGLSTTGPSVWWGVADRTKLPLAVSPGAWSSIKAAYR